MNNRVVQLTKPHTNVAEGMPVEMKFGNTRITIDTSYIDTLTEEQRKLDEAMLSDAVWALYDEFTEENLESAS